MSSSNDKTRESELLDKAIMALSGEYIEKPDGDGQEAWNSAVGYCIGKLRVMQEQLPIAPSHVGAWSDIEQRIVEMIRYIGVKAGVADTVYGEMCHEARCILRNAHLDYTPSSTPSVGEPVAWMVENPVDESKHPHLTELLRGRKAIVSAAAAGEYESEGYVVTPLYRIPSATTRSADIAFCPACEKEWNK